LEKLANEIIQGRRLTKEDDLSALLTMELEELCDGADCIRAKLCGNRVSLCNIINGRGGRCSENCKFCAQSAHYHTECEEYGFLDQEILMQGCARAEELGLDRYSIVTADRSLEGEEFEKALQAYEAMHRAYPDMKLCASHGLLSVQSLRRLKAAGISTYHSNVETSERFFPEICTTHTYADKIKEIQRVKEAGLSVCSGGILGMGETWQDRLDMALLLAELEVGSIPLNFLIPIPGTAFAQNEILTQEEMLRITAVFRYINPTAYIRIAAGRVYFEDGGRRLFCSGANATLTGDMLTTVGNKTAQDRAMLEELHFEIGETKRRMK
jgi:biotin synthase